MTEAEWLAAMNPMPMVEFLRGKTSDRKLRLFACAICRGFWDSITYDRSRRAVELAERYADGLEADEALLRAWNLAIQAAADCGTRMARGKLTRRDGRTPEECLLHLAANTAHVHKPYLIGRLKRHLRGQEVIERSPPLLRDILGNPFRPVAPEPSCITPTVTALARQMYDSRDFTPMPILGDALQDAGCEDAAILGHCRGEGPHVRGCCVVDAVLGKE